MLAKISMRLAPGPDDRDRAIHAGHDARWLEAVEAGNVIDDRPRRDIVGVPSTSPLPHFFQAGLSGGALVVALSLISLRGGTPQETARLSGMAQSLGYLLAARGPFLAGHLTQATGTWTPSLVLLAGLAVTQLLVAVSAGRERGLINVP